MVFIWFAAFWILFLLKVTVWKKLSWWAVFIPLLIPVFAVFMLFSAVTFLAFLAPYLQ